MEQITCPTVKTEVNEEDLESEEDDLFFNATKADSNVASSSGEREKEDDDDDDEEDEEYTPKVKRAEFVISKRRRAPVVPPERLEKGQEKDEGRRRSLRSNKGSSQLEDTQKHIQIKKKGRAKKGRGRKKPTKGEESKETKRQEKERKKHRHDMTPEELEKVRIKDRERVRMNRAQKTPAQLEEIRRKDRERARLRRAIQRGVDVPNEFGTPQARVTKQKPDGGDDETRIKIVVKTEPSSESEDDEDTKASPSKPKRPRVRPNKQNDPIAREEYLRVQRELKRQSRAKETPEQVEARKQREREYKRKVRAQMTPEQKKEYSTKIQFRRFEKRAQMTEEELKQYKMAQYMKFVARQASLTPEQLERERERARIRARERAKALKPQTEEEKQKHREMMRNTRKNWSEERKQKVKQQMKEYFQRYKARLINENPEKWEERKRKNKEYWAKYRRTGLGRKKEPKTEEEKRVRKFLVNRASTRRSQLKKRLTIQTLVEKGVRPEEIQRQMEPPEQRERRLLRTRLVKRKRLLRLKLVEQGLPPEEIQTRLDEFEANFETTTPIKPYKPRRFLSKPVDHAELEKLEATRRYRLTKHMKVIALPESRPVPIVDAPWADPSKYGVSIPVLTKTVTIEPLPGGASSSLTQLETRHPPSTATSLSSTSTSFSSRQRTQNQYPHQRLYQPSTFPFEQKHQIPQQAGYGIQSQSSTYNQYHHNNQQPAQNFNYSHGENKPEDENLYDAVSSLDDDGSCHNQDTHDDDYYEPTPPPEPRPSTSSYSTPMETVPPKRRGRGPAKKPKADSQNSTSSNQRKPSRRDKMYLRKSKRDNADQICDLCGNFYTVKYLPDHKLFMHNPEYLKGTCIPCNIFFPTNRHYHNHWIHHHRVIKLPVQATDPKRSVICDICGTAVASLHNLDKHKHFMHGEGSRPENYVQCPFCSTKVKSNNILNQHIRTVHPKEGYINCARCEQRFSSTGKYKEHVKEEHPEAYFPCDICGLLKFSKSTLNFHYMQCRVRLREKGKEGKEEEKKKVVVEDDVPDHIYKQQAYRLSTLRCEVCQLKVLITSLKRHYMNIHGILEEKFNCFHCDKFFSRREYWIMHSEEVHAVNIEDEEIREKFSKYNVSDRSKVVVKRPEGIKRMPRSDRERRDRISRGSGGGDGEQKRKRRRRRTKKEIEEEEEKEKEENEWNSEESGDEEWISPKKKKEEEKAVSKKKGRRGRPRRKAEKDEDDEEEEEDKSFVPVRHSVRGRRRRIAKGACDFQNVESERRLVIVLERLSEEEIGKYQRINHEENVALVVNEHNIKLEVE